MVFWGTIGSESCGYSKPLVKDLVSLV